MILRKDCGVGMDKKPVARKKRTRNPPAQIPPADQRERLKPVSLYPLTFDQAIDALIALPTRKLRRK
jgi:hypothetical protein